MRSCVSRQAFIKAVVDASRARRSGNEGEHHIAQPRNLNSGQRPRQRLCDRIRACEEQRSPYHQRDAAERHVPGYPDGVGDLQSRCSWSGWVGLIEPHMSLLRLRAANGWTSDATGSMCTSAPRLWRSFRRSRFDPESRHRAASTELQSRERREINSEDATRSVTAPAKTRAASMR